MPWPCFMIEPTDRCRRWLRRMSDATCVLTRLGHHAMVSIEDGPVSKVTDQHGWHWKTTPADWAQDDQRWPRHCDCGYPFGDEDRRQLFFEVLYVRPDTGDEMPLRFAPAGAMYDASWFPAFSGPDGLSLTVVLPGWEGPWHIDGPSGTGGRWARTGVPPLVTVTPSINVPGKYHGWLSNGVLTDDVEGRVISS